MKTLLLVGGVLFLLLGFLLLVAAIVVFLIARNRRAKALGPQAGMPQPMQQPRPAPPAQPARPVAPPPAAAPRPAAPPPPLPPPPSSPPRQSPLPPPPAAAPAPAPPPSDSDATVIAGVASFGTLHCTIGLLAGQSFPIKLDGVYIGRDRTQAQIVIEHPSVSKRHVWIGVREGAVVAVDHGSTNGTYLNEVGTRIAQVGLTPGDTIIISDDIARFVYKG